MMSLLHELGLALHRKGESAGALPLFREAVEIGRRVPHASPQRLESLLYYARLVHRFDGDAARAEPLYREALALARATHEGDHQDVAVVLAELARDLRDLGRPHDAEPLVREALSMFRRLYGNRHREVLVAAQTLSGLLGDLGRPDEAELLGREALATARDLLGQAHPLTLGAQRALAGLLEGRRRFPEAAALRKAELEAATRARGEHDVYVALGLAGLAHHHELTGRLDLAEAYRRRALAVRERIHPPGHWRIDEARVALGACLVRAGRLAEAEPLVVGGYERLRAVRGPDAEETRAAAAHLEALRAVRAGVRAPRGVGSPPAPPPAH